MTTTKTKSGAASLYVVIFTTLLLGIITLGFIRIMLSGSLQTSNADLSQSAFDSALAGVEDAKVALLKYHDCVSSNSTEESCVKAIEAMRAADSTANCDIVRTILGRTGENETIIQSEDGANGIGADMQQAYTCVLIDQDGFDYLGQLNQGDRSRMIPLRTENINALKYIRLSWYSNTNANSVSPNERMPESSSNPTNKPSSYEDASNTGLFPALSTPPSAPPVLGVQLIQTDSTFYLKDLDANNGDNTDRGTLLLVPFYDDTYNPSTDSPSIGRVVESNRTTGFTASSDKAINTPTPIRCESDANTGQGYLCMAVLGVPAPFNTVNNINRSDSSAFLRVFLPYGAPPTDFQIALCTAASADSCFTDSAALQSFIGVQARVDSTGRANDLFRRIESRIELVDIYFPFPEYAAVIRGTEADSLSKNFWVTKNNWGGADSGYVK